MGQDFVELHSYIKLNYLKSDLTFGIHQKIKIYRFYEILLKIMENLGPIFYEQEFSVNSM